MVVLAILAVSASLVGATVILSSNWANLNGTNSTNISGTNVIQIQAAAGAGPGTSALYVGDSAGVNYALTGSTPDDLSSATLTIIVSMQAPSGGWGVWGPPNLNNNIGTVSLTINGNGPYTAGAGTIVTAGSLTQDTFTISGLSLAKGSIVGNLNIVYNAVGNYNLAISLSGTAA
jgi:hypothetical protein